MHTDDTALELPATRLRRNWVMPFVALVLAGAGLLFPGRELAPLGVLAAWVAGWFAFFTVVRNALRAKSSVWIRATEQGLELEGQPSIEPADIVELRTTPHPGSGGEVDLDLVLREGRSLTLWLRDSDARALLEKLGIGVGERRARFRLARSFLRRFLVMFVALNALGLVLALATWKSSLEALLVVPLDAAIFALPLALLAGLFKGTAIVGTDGVVIRWLTSRFVPFGDVAELRKDQGAGPVRLLLRTGKRMTLQAVEEPEADADRGAKGLALHRHLEESLGRFRQRKTAAEAVALLRRNDRSPKDWGLAIDSIVRSNAGGYRVATIAEQTLMEVATGTEGPLDARVGAAAALIRRVGFDGASRTDEERRIRVAVRIAADACVERRARVALEALADAQSADELERALGYLTEP